MDQSALKARVAALLADSSTSNGIELQNRLYLGTLTVMNALYGSGSSQERELRNAIERITRGGRPDAGSTIHACIEVTKGALLAMQAEIDVGFVGSLGGTITAAVLSDLVKLARAVFTEAGDGAKNVAAVLAAAAFEDCLRRLCSSRGLTEPEKLADVVTVLKDAAVLQGAQVGVGQSYLQFRNRALHAKWEEIDRPEVASVLGFVEELLLKHFP